MVGCRVIEAIAHLHIHVIHRCEANKHNWGELTRGPRNILIRGKSVAIPRKHIDTPKGSRIILYAGWD